MSKIKQEQLDELTKPEEGELVDDNLNEIEGEEKEEDETRQTQKRKENEKKVAIKEKPIIKAATLTTETPKPNIEVHNEADLLLKKYSEQIDKEEEEVIEDAKDVDQENIDTALELEGIEVTDEQLVKEAAERQRKRQTYFGIEAAKEWHKIPMFVKWDGRGHAVYRMKAYKFHDYPYEVRHVIDAIRGEYEDLYKAKQILDFARWFRDPNFRNVSQNYVQAQDKWIQVGSKFILHMKEKDLDLAHKDYILLIIDSFMYRQDTRLPNLQIRSSPTSAENRSTSEDSAQQSGIQ